MARRDIVTAVDVGTAMVQTVVAERVPDRDTLQILAVGSVPSAGVRRGAVIDIEDTAAAIRQSVDQARKTAGVPIKSAWVGVDGAYISSLSVRGVVAVSRADQEIAPEDVQRVLAAAETFIPKNHNKEVLHIIPREFKVDNESGVRDPIGMHGVRLEVEALVVEATSGAYEAPKRTWRDLA
ncbi:MAG: cell division protein FtsA [Parcubacteria group bacterium Greene0714_36]|nr:MAG: cell division protein FtsA [Parcubacteria group bacterium Greene0714_36]